MKSEAGPSELFCLGVCRDEGNVSCASSVGSTCNLLLPAKSYVNGISRSYFGSCEPIRATAKSGDRNPKYRGNDAVRTPKDWIQNALFLRLSRRPWYRKGVLSHPSGSFEQNKARRRHSSPLQTSGLYTNDSFLRHPTRYQPSSWIHSWLFVFRHPPVE